MAIGGLLLSAICRCTIQQCHKRNCNTMASLLVPPASVRGTTQLDREAFNSNLDVPCVVVDSLKLSKVLSLIKKYLLKLHHVKPVTQLEGGNKSIALLDPRKINNFNDLNESKVKELLTEDDFQTRKLPLTYENWPAAEALKAILPEDMDTPTSYSLIGHILHLNLREEQLPYKSLIGEVYLDKINNVKTVVNKLDVIDTTYRHFAMEILAGVNDTVATVKENGSTFQFDFAKVYWNPRLGNEHALLVSKLNVQDVLYDAFAGVGPFAIPAARKGCKVLANDLNPESYKWLNRNVTLNKKKGSLQAFNKDAREFLETDVKRDILQRRKNGEQGREHIAMNLPASAIDFLDVFFTWFTADEAKLVYEKPPIVHLYCFARVASDEDPCECARLLVQEKLNCTLSSNDLVDVHLVRNVAPNKEMVRVSFQLSVEMLKTTDEEPASKKIKITRDTDELIDKKILGSNGKEQAETVEAQAKCI